MKKTGFATEPAHCYERQCMSTCAGMRACVHVCLRACVRVFVCVLCICVWGACRAEFDDGMIEDKTLADILPGHPTFVLVERAAI